MASLKGKINKVTGVSSTVNGARGSYRVNAGKSAKGTSRGFGNREQKRGDLRAAFGGGG